MMKHILWEIGAAALECYRVAELVKVVRELEDIEIVKILRDN